MIAARKPDYENPSEGTVQAVISNVYDLGLQKNVGMFGEKLQYQVVVMFEINETMRRGPYAGKRFVMSRTYGNIISDKSNLKRDLTILVGEKMAVPDFDLEHLIGVNCLLQVGINDKGYANIVSLMALPKGMTPMTPELPRDHKPEWIGKKQSEQIVEDDIPEQKAAVSLADDPDAGFANEGDVQKNIKLAEIFEWRHAGTLTMSKLIATTKLQTGHVITKTEDLEGLSLEEVTKVYNGVKPE